MSDIVKRNKLRKKQEKYAKVYSKVNSLLEQYDHEHVVRTRCFEDKIY